MTALSANREAKRQDGDLINYPVLGSAHIYKGAMVVDVGTGYLSAGSAAGAYTFLGVAAEEGDNSASATDGAKEVRVYKTGVFQFAKPSAVQSDIGVAMYLRDDQTVDTTVTNSILVGYCVDIVDTSHVKVRIDAAVK